MADEDGRPMTPSLVDAKNVVVRDFSVIQPQFWFVNPGFPKIADFLLFGQGSPQCGSPERPVSESLHQRDQ